MSKTEILCPKCGFSIEVYKNPLPTVDIIIEIGQGIVLIKRRNYPYGWALPGGFVDYGESVEEAALREAKEETGLTVKLKGLLGVYSDPKRDPRQHTISTVFVATSKGRPVGGDDAEQAMVFPLNNIDVPLAFDHQKIIHDYLLVRQGKAYLCPIIG